ncbi:MAG TPA: SRPBCC family protein [Gemmatimonadaceae bacterium]|nr:SRPBCC family protein [Gemmatimonadaceae bacterium]
MATATDETAGGAVRRTIRVNAPAARAFNVFTHEFDSWWPRTHHIGKSKLKRAVIEERVGGRCYSEQVDDVDCDWGTILAWEPPRRLVFAWQINADWTYQPDLAQSSEVEVTFTQGPDGFTDVVLEHRNFERHGPAGGVVRANVSAEGGWGMLLQRYAAEADGRPAAGVPREGRA